MSLYTKARKHIDMDRVKELREEKIKRKKIADEIREQIREELRNLNNPEFSNWRCDLDESMTTSGLMSTTLPATGDVDLVTTEQTFETSFNGNNESVSGGEVILSGSSNSIAGGTHTIYRRAMFKVDGSKSSTLKLTISKGGGTSSWTDRDPPENFNDDVVVNVYQASSFSGPSYYNANLSSGTHLINLPGQFEDLQIQIEQYAKVSATGALRITGASLQRRTPVNAFVSLDSPEATAFIRTDPSMQGLSSEEKKKKLEDMLDASNEYLLKQLGITGSSAKPSDTTMPVSWDQAAGGATDAMSDDLYNWVNKTYGLPAAEWKKENPTKPDNSNPFLPKGSYVPKASGGKDYGNVASAKGPYGTPGADKPYVRKGYKDKDGKFVDYDNPSTWPSILKKAGNNKDTMDDRWRAKATAYTDSWKAKAKAYTDSWKAANTKHVNAWKKQLDLAHHEPEGEVLSEKKRLKSPKDITSKISGYYDGKPAPLGFPMQEPPKMVNGKHPDLVDGKKIANRFNRLDPQSAKAMPPTGNPYIDKKVRAAAKKPK